jgi:hypothetical protein
MWEVQQRTKRRSFHRRKSLQEQQGILHQQKN